MWISLRTSPKSENGGELLFPNCCSFFICTKLFVIPFFVTPVAIGQKDRKDRVLLLFQPKEQDWQKGKSTHLIRVYPFLAESPEISVGRLEKGFGGQTTTES